MAEAEKFEPERGFVVDDGKGYGGGKRFVKIEESDDEYAESDKSIVIPIEEDYSTLHFYYNYGAYVS